MFPFIPPVDWIKPMPSNINPPWTYVIRSYAYFDDCYLIYDSGVKVVGEQSARIDRGQPRQKLEMKHAMVAG